MKQWTTLHEFYVSKEWRGLCEVLKSGCHKCAHCRRHIDDRREMIGHHKIDLTINNVHDFSVSLNPDNVEIICLQCHNKEHRRFGNAKHVYIVWGSPFAGKHAAVRDMMRYGDIAVDIDAIWRAVTLGNDKPNPCRFNVFRMRDCMLDQIKTRYGQWYDAYIIGGYANPCDLARDTKLYGAQALYCDSTREECLTRAIKAGVGTDWVIKWWDDYKRMAI